MTSGFRLPSEYTTSWSVLLVGVYWEVLIEIMKACNHDLASPFHGEMHVYVLKEALNKDADFFF